MRPMRYLRFAAAVIAAVGLMLIGSPAQAWDNGTYLRTGDVFCTDQVRADGGVRFTGHITNGSATATIRVSAAPRAAESVAWSQSATNIDFNKYLTLVPGMHYRGCVTVTGHTVNTWGRSFIMAQGSTGIGDIGPHTARLSP